MNIWVLTDDQERYWGVRRQGNISGPFTEVNSDCCFSSLEEAESYLSEARKKNSSIEIMKLTATLENSNSWIVPLSISFAGRRLTLISNTDEVKKIYFYGDGSLAISIRNADNAWHVYANLENYSEDLVAEAHNHSLNEALQALELDFRSLVLNEVGKLTHNLNELQKYLDK